MATTTQNRGARLDQVLTIYMTPKDARELEEKMRAKWQAMATQEEETHVMDWRGENCRIQFKLDAFRTAGVFGPPGTVIPPPGPQLDAKDHEAINAVVSAGPEGQAMLLLGIISKLLGVSPLVCSSAPKSAKDPFAEFPPTKGDAKKRK